MQKKNDKEFIPLLNLDNIDTTIDLSGIDTNIDLKDLNFDLELEALKKIDIEEEIKKLKDLDFSKINLEGIKFDIEDKQKRGGIK